MAKRQLPVVMVPNSQHVFDLVPADGFLDVGIGTQPLSIPPGLVIKIPRESLSLVTKSGFVTEDRRADYYSIVHTLPDGNRIRGYPLFFVELEFARRRDASFRPAATDEDIIGCSILQRVSDISFIVLRQELVRLSL